MCPLKLFFHDARATRTQANHPQETVLMLECHYTARMDRRIHCRDLMIMMGDGTETDHDSPHERQEMKK
ncbi:hypothetical protein INR49_012771 [Caranx melampygus]|nr:hypothetical protein INR49_012771 [Caranx melampygus]